LLKRADMCWCRNIKLLALLVIIGMSAVVACSSDVAARKQRFLESGNRYIQDGKTAEAIIEYRNAIAIDPKFGGARSRLAEAYAKTGQANSALGEYVRAADLLPDDIEIQLSAGTYLMAAGRVTEALAKADAALKRQPNNVAAHILRGNALGGLNDLDRALGEMEEAIRLDPGRSASYLQLGLVEHARGRGAEAESALKRAVELAPNWVGGHLALATFYLSAGRLPETERALTSALVLEPDHLGANRAMAVFLQVSGRAASAEKYLKHIADTSKTPAGIFALTDYYIAMRRPGEAVARLRSIVDDSPTGSAARQRLAHAYRAAGENARAQSLVEEMLKHDPSDAQAHLLKGQLAWDLGRRDEALADVQAAVAAEPRSALHQFALGKMYSAKGDTAGAERAFREVLKLNPRASVAQVELATLQLTMGDPTSSLRTAEEAVRTQPDSLEVRLALVRSLLAAKQIPKAESEIKALLGVRPAAAAVHTQAGVLAAMKNDVVKARGSFEHAIKLDPRSLEALAGLIALELNAKNLVAAKSRVARALESGTSSPELMLLAARSYASAGDLELTEKTLRRAIDAEPTLLPAYAMLGRLYIQQRKLDQARREFDALADRQSRPVGALTMSGVLLQVQGQDALARERFERAVAIDPRAAVAANNLAWMYAEAGENLERATVLAQSAAEVLQEMPEVLDTLGWVHYKNNLPALAVPILGQSVEKDPKNPLYHYHLGLALVRVGDKDKGRRSLQRTLDLEPKFSAAEDVRRTLAGLGN
jgi:tetratricopeptide (TPR) repeat protein